MTRGVNSNRGRDLEVNVEATIECCEPCRGWSLDEVRPRGIREKSAQDYLVSSILQMLLQSREVISFDVN
jgi:hypothetical protein